MRIEHTPQFREAGLLKCACAHAARAPGFVPSKPGKTGSGGEAVNKTRRIFMLLPLRTPSVHAIHLMAYVSLPNPTRSAQGRNPAPECVDLHKFAHPLHSTRCSPEGTELPLFITHQRRTNVHTCFGTPEPVFLRTLPSCCRLTIPSWQMCFSRGSCGCVDSSCVSGHRDLTSGLSERVFASFCRARQKEVPARHERRGGSQR